MKNTIILNFQFIKTITDPTTSIFKISLNIIKRPSPKISAIRSMSVTVLVNKTPTEELSKYFILKPRICLNNLILKSLTTD